MTKCSECRTAILLSFTVDQPRTTIARDSVRDFYSGDDAMKSKPTSSLDAYIAGFPQDVQKKLNKVRATIRKAAPGVEERISYRIMGFFLEGRMLIYAAAFKSHIGLYPAPIESVEFKTALAVYASGKATAKFTFDKPIPLGLIAKIVKFRARENRVRAASKKKKA